MKAISYVDGVGYVVRDVELSYSTLCQTVRERDWVANWLRFRSSYEVESVHLSCFHRPSGYKGTTTIDHSHAFGGPVLHNLHS